RNQEITMTVDDQFNTLNEKLQLLARQYSRLQRENERLKEELHRAREKETAKQNAMDDVQQQISILKVASDEMSENDKREYEKKINQYIDRKSTRLNSSH